MTDDSMSQELFTQVRSEATKLTEGASEGLRVFQSLRLDNIGEEGRELYNREKQLNDIANDVLLALRRREEQLQDEQRHQLRGEDLVWKSTHAHLERCSRILQQLRRILLGWNTEFEPTRARTMLLQLKLSVLQKRKIRKLYSRLNCHFQALQVNGQAVNIFLQVDTQEKIGQTNERIAETNQRVDKTNNKVDEMLSMLADVYEQLMEMNRNASSLPSSPLPSRTEHSRGSGRIDLRVPLDRDEDTDDAQEEDADDQNDEAIYSAALRGTREILSTKHVAERSSSVAVDSAVGSCSNGSESDTENTRRPGDFHQRTISITPATATAADYPNAIAQFPKKPLGRYNDIVDEYSARARKFVKEEQFNKADGELTLAIDWARQRKHFYGIPFPEIEMQDMLGDIYRKSNQFHKALDIWLHLLPRQGDDEDSVTLQHCKHYHLVAETYYDMWRFKRASNNLKLDNKEDLHMAIRNAESAYNKRHHILNDEEAPELKESAELLARIYEALGNSAEASVYRRRASSTATEANTSSEAPDGAEDRIEGTLLPGEKPTSELVKAIKYNRELRALALLKNNELSFSLERLYSKSKAVADEKWTPLMLAFRCTSEAVIEALLEHGSDITKTDPTYRRSILHQAAAKSEPEKLRLAVKSCKEGMMEQKDKYGMTPLLLCVAENGEHVLEAIRILLEAGAKFTALDDQGDSPLHLAVRNSSKPASKRDLKAPSRATNLLKFLLTHESAKVDVKNHLGNTPLMVACEYGHATTAEILLKAKANANARNKCDQSPIYVTVDGHAVLPNYENTVRMLLNHGATVNKKELPAKWKDFQHLNSSFPATSIGPSTRDRVRRSSATRRTEPSSTAAYTGNEQRLAVPSEGLRRATTRFDDEALSEQQQVGRAHRADSTSTTATNESRSSGGMSRILSWGSRR